MGAHYFYADDPDKGTPGAGVEIRRHRTTDELRNMFLNPPTDPRQTYSSATKNAWTTVVRTHVNSPNVAATRSYRAGEFPNHFM
ncbi:MAG: hypothetical protein ABSF90_31155 [Syntrophobacteraceae bacterium]|jgi:hypothetical protein